MSLKMPLALPKILVSFDTTISSSSLHSDDETLDLQARFPNVSFVRGSERKSIREFSASGNIFDNNAVPKKRLSFGNSVISDEDFLDDEAAKEMILKDQKENEEELSLEHMYENCTGCSSWVPATSKKLSDLPVPIDTDIIKDQTKISVSAFIQMRSEDLGFLSGEPKEKVPKFFGCSTSTPTKFGSTVLEFDVSSIFENERAMRNLDMEIKDMTDFSTWKAQHHEYGETPKKLPMFPKVLYSVAKKPMKPENPDPLHYLIGTTCYRNIQKLKAEERKKANWLSESIIRQTDKDLEIRSRNFKVSCSTNETLFSEFSSSNGRIPSSYGKESIMEQLTVHPQEIDITRGNRLQLTNNSTKDIKFKVEFDIRIISVSPVFGIIHAKNQIGLRILVLRTSKQQIEDTETTIRILSGKNEKTVIVKILKEKKSKLKRKRSFILN